MRKITQVALAFGAVVTMAAGFSIPSKAHDPYVSDQYASYDTDVSQEYHGHRQYYRHHYYDPYYRYSDEYQKRIRRGDSPYFFRYYYKGFSTHYSSYTRGYDVR